MTPTATIMEHPASFDNYTRIGWHLVPIAPGSKGPKTAGWQLKENCITDASRIPNGYGAGLAHAYSGTCAIDIDDWDVSVQTLGFVGIDLLALCNADDAVLIHSGNPGHAKLIYKMPFGIVLPSKKCIHTTAEGLKKNWIDFRCATADGKTVQDVLAPSIHPITQRPYQWAGRGSYTNLPLIPGELLAYWRAIIDAEEQRTITVSGSQVSASWDEIKQALTYISPDCDREQWVSVLMALHYAGTATNKPDEALVVADEWSAQSATKYKGQKDILNSWRGFNPDKGVKLGTLFHLARQAGWQRPIPDVSTMFTATIEEIESPKSLADQIATPTPRVDYDLFPPLLAQRAKEVGVSMACDPLVAAFAGLGAAAAAVDARTRLELMPSWKVPPILWLMTIGSPSAKKSPAAEPMMGILSQIEKEHRAVHAANELIFKAHDAAHASALKAYNAAAADPHWALSGSDLSSLPQVPERPPVPIPKRLVVSDITSQKLVRMCADRPQGLLCHLDEMQAWCKKLAGVQTGESRSSWITAYDCRSQPMDRVGDGSTDSNTTIIADNYAVSIYGNCQPKVFRAYVKELTEDGLMQRFIPAIVRDEYSDKLNQPIPDHLTSSAQYEQHIRLIHALPATTYRLSPEAFTRFRKFQEWYISLKQDERLLNAESEYITAIGKLEGTAGRIILFWHLFENPHAQEVSDETCLRALKFTTTYLVNALRYLYGEVGELGTDSVDTHIRDHVMQHAGESQTITLSDMKRSARRKLEHLPSWQQDEMVKSAMYVLEKAQWVKMVEHNQKSIVWAIDPRVADIFPEHRKNVIAAKQRIYDRIHDLSDGRVPHRKVVGSDILS